MNLNFFEHMLVKESPDRITIEDGTEFIYDSRAAAPVTFLIVQGTIFYTNNTNLYHSSIIDHLSYSIEQIEEISGKKASLAQITKYLNLRSIKILRPTAIMKDPDALVDLLEEFVHNRDAETGPGGVDGRRTVPTEGVVSGRLFRLYPGYITFWEKREHVAKYINDINIFLKHMSLNPDKVKWEAYVGGREKMTSKQEFTTGSKTSPADSKKEDEDRAFKLAQHLVPGFKKLVNKEPVKWKKPEAENRFFKPFESKKPNFQDFVLKEAGNERQEQGLIDSIRQAIEVNGGNPITIKGIPDKIKGADKMHTSPHGHEPYTDVILFGVTRDWNISCKGPAAPSLAGGGVAGLIEILPEDSKFLADIHDSIIQAYYKHGLKEDKIYPASKVPDVSIEIPKGLRLIIIKGVKSMGGPIDFMYIGEMDVKYNSTTGFNGKFISVEEYANHPLFIRARKRDLTKSAFPDVPPRIKFVPNKINPATGLPMILQVATEVKAVFGKNALRIVTTDKPSSQAISGKL